MKKILVLASALVFSFAVMAQPKNDDVVKFNTEKYDFGKLQHNVPVTYYFEIKNTGKTPLVVENASADCGCTVPEKPEQPIAPGATAKLKVVFKAPAVQPFTKNIYIKFAGIDQQKIVSITGEVLSAEAYAALPKSEKKTKG